MKKSILLTLLTFSFIGLTFVYGCSNDDDNPIANTYPVDAPKSAKVTIATAENATIDALWEDAESVEINTVVPTYDVGMDGHDIWWDEYEVDESVVTLKSVYTDDNIYFLFQWTDSDESRTRMAWYYHPDAVPENAKWLQMGKKYPDEFGNPPAYEDKFTMFWRITGNTLENSGCASMCHGARMGTNSPADC